MSATIRRSPKNSQNPYAQIRRATLEDESLSWEARGVLAYLLAKPDDWAIHISDLIKRGPGGRDRMYRIVNELISHAYLERADVRDDEGQYIGIEYLIIEEPYVVLQDTEKADYTNKELVVKTNNKEDMPAAYTPDGVQGALFVEETALPPQQVVVEKESPPIKPKDHPAVQAYRALVERYPNRAQMKMIAESNPDMENWINAMRTWIGRGYNPGNVDDMLKWAENPALMERRATAKGKFDPTEGASWAEMFEESEQRMARQEQPYA